MGYPQAMSDLAIFIIHAIILVVVFFALWEPLLGALGLKKP